MRPVWVVDGVFRIGYPSEFVLALVSGLPSYERTTHRMAVIQAQAYADDSGKEPPVYVFSGFVSTSAAWALFSDEWQSALDSARPHKISHMKMRDAYAREKQFSGFTKEERDDLLSTLWQIIGKHAQYGVSVVIDATRYAAELKGKVSRTLDSPYFILNGTFVDEVINFERRRGLSRVVDFIFDEQGLESEQVQVYWKLVRTKFYPHWHRKRLGSPPIWRCEQQFRPRQAADMLAWTVRRLAEQSSSVSDVNEIASRLKAYVPELSIPIIFPQMNGEHFGQFMTREMMVRGNNYETAKMRSELRKKRKKVDGRTPL